MGGFVQVVTMIFGPLAVAAVLQRRWRLSWSLWAMGAFGFVLSQVVHLPLLWLTGDRLKTMPFAWACVVVGALAGICEEPARYWILRRHAKRYEEAVFLGLGHGGVEAILVGVLVALGLLGSLAVSDADPDRVRAAAAATLNAASLDRLLATLERAMAMTFHVAMACLVLYAVRGRTWMLGAAIVLHGAGDALAVFAMRQHGLLGAESVAAIATVLTVSIIAAVRRSELRSREAAHGVVDHADEPLVDQAISARALTKRFADRAAVDALSLDVAAGKVFVLLGPNGAGKTTTVRMLCALIPPTAGTARVAGALVVSEADQLRAHVGFLTETPGLYERLTAWENLELYARLYGIDAPTRARRIEAHLRAFDLWERRDERVSGFSKGMKQKVAIVRALLHDPDVLFLDEPTTGLDPGASREVRAMIAKLKQQGRTILLTTHRLVEAEELADVVAIIRGKLLVMDTVAALRSRVFGRQVQVRVANPSPALAIDGGTWVGDTLTLGVSDPALEMPALIRTLVERGAQILSATEATHSLEDVYLELTHE